MTSYQKRKEEIKRLKAEIGEILTITTITKHLLLAEARGKTHYKNQCIKAVLNRIKFITDLEREEIESLLKK